MGSDHSSLALVHNVDDIEAALKHRNPNVSEGHGWSRSDISGDLDVSKNGEKTIRTSQSTQKLGVKGCKAYTYGLHFFEFTWSRNTSKDLSIGIATSETSLISDEEILLGIDEQSVGWNPVSRNIHYNKCVIKNYPDKKKSTVDVPSKLVMILNMDQGILSFKTDDQDLGVAMSGLKHIAEELYVAACLSDKDDEICIKYLGGSTTLDDYDWSSDNCSSDSDDSDASADTLQFHTSCGPNIKLNCDNMEASRKRPRTNYNNATVLTNRPLNEEEEFKIKITDIDKSNWSGLLVIGVTTNNPKRFEFPADTMIECTQGDTWAFRENKVKHNGEIVQELSTDIDSLQVDSTIAIAIKRQTLELKINGKREQVQVGSTKKLFGFVDVYGQTTCVKLVPGKHGIVKTKKSLTKTSSKSNIQRVSSLDELFSKMKEKNPEDIELISGSLKYFSSSKLERSRMKRRSAGDELSKGDRPKIIKQYIQFLINESTQLSMQCFTLLLHILANYTDCSLMFCKKIGKVGLLELLQKYLKSSEPERSLLEVILTVLYNCAQASENKACFRRNDYVKFAQRYLDTDNYNIIIVTLTFFTMSYVYTAENIPLLELPEEIVIYTITCLDNAVQSDDHSDDEGWHIRELMLAITNLTANSSNIYNFVQNSDIEILMKVLKTDSVYEKECALNTIWNLINDQTKELVAGTEDLLQMLDLMAECEHSTIEQAVKRIQAKLTVTGQMLPGPKPGEKCKYKATCERFKKTLNLSEAYFNSKYDMCYCDNCHASRGDCSTYTRGDPPQDYGVPVGWCRFGLMPAPRAEPLGAFDKWHRAFHGTRKENVESILRVGELAPAGRTVLGKKTIKELPNHFNENFKPDKKFNTKRIFLSPSVRYSGVDTYASPSKFKDPLTGKSHNAKVVFQVLVNPKSYEVGAETIGACGEIDPGFSNQELEWIVDEMGATLLYGLLVQVNNSF